jgi:DNA (cytosine-5)-methyltransferase 1
MTEPLRVLDLFSGIGGFSLGLERTGGFKTVAFCEIEPFCQKVLHKHWPGVPVYSDVRMLRGYIFPNVDVITGGFPCQDLSIAGKQRGIEGERSGLWSDLCRLISEIRPRYALVENVTNLLSGPREKRGGWFGRVLGDLAKIGFDAEWHCIPACSVGAPHIRDRVWLVAYPKQIKRICPIFNAHDAEEAKGGGEAIWGTNGVRSKVGTSVCSISGSWVDKPEVDRMVDGVSDWPHRLAACGNAVVPQIPELIGHAILAAEAA